MEDYNNLCFAVTLVWPIRIIEWHEDEVTIIDSSVGEISMAAPPTLIS